MEGEIISSFCVLGVALLVTVYMLLVTEARRDKMTNQQAQKQIADYRAAAADYSNKGNGFVATQLLEIANRMESILVAQK
jgi:hypothetical protein